MENSSPRKIDGQQPKPCEPVSSALAQTSEIQSINPNQEPSPASEGIQTLTSDDIIQRMQSSQEIIVVHSQDNSIVVTTDALQNDIATNSSAPIDLSLSFAADNTSVVSKSTTPSVATSTYKSKIEAEIKEELAHPEDIFITQLQYRADKECAEFSVRAHLEGIMVDLKVAKTIFCLSSFHFKEDNHSMQLYTDPSAGSRRQEYVDFTRRKNDGYVLYLWDQRIAIMLTILNSETNTYQPRFFVAMTNLYMPLGGGNVQKELVLLDILVRMDIHSHVDALVGVVATGEVRLWKYSKEHLRFLHCDFQHEIERGENFWIAKRHQYYEERGLIYLPQRMIPRDLDAPRTRFAVSKEYITNYKRTYSSESELQANFDKWTILPGRFKSLKELADKAKSTGKRHDIGNAAAEKERSEKMAQADAIKERNAEINKRRQDTRKKNQGEKRKEEERKLLSKLVAEGKRTSHPTSFYGSSLPPLPPPTPPPPPVHNMGKSHHGGGAKGGERDFIMSSSSRTYMTTQSAKKTDGGLVSQRERGNI